MTEEFNEIEGQLNKINDRLLKLETLLIEMQYARKDIEKLEERVRDLEKNKNKTKLEVFDQVVKYIIGAALGYIAFKVGLK